MYRYGRHVHGLVHVGGYDDKSRLHAMISDEIWERHVLSSLAMSGRDRGSSVLRDILRRKFHLVAYLTLFLKP